MAILQLSLYVYVV